MALNKMPIFCWYILAMALMIASLSAVEYSASILLSWNVRRLGILSKVRRGDPLLWQHLFWLFATPRCNINLPASSGYVSTLIPYSPSVAGRL